MSELSSPDLTLKAKTNRWKIFALLLFFALIFQWHRDFMDLIDGLSGKIFIGSMDIQGKIVNDNTQKERLAKLAEIAEDRRIAGLILHINSPGGTFVASQNLHNAISKVSSKKPVVVVMEDLAASGGYMAAIAADHIIANPGTLTGSIGVIVQYFGISDLAQKIGVNMQSIKSSELKGTLSPFEKLSNKGERAIKDVVDEMYQYFVRLVSKKRDMSFDEAIAISDGRVYTGEQALKIGLVDEVGGEDEALKWLSSKTDVIAVRDLNEKEGSFFKDFRLSKFISSAVSFEENLGLMAILNW